MQFDSSPSKTIFFLLIILGAIGGYLYYSQIVKSDIQIDVPPLPPQSDLSHFKNLSLDFTIANKPEIQEVRVFGESPVQPGSGGKANLFAPF